uniref:ZZ-type domain-containing protein n=3 Tax=Loa loa TaxID=7209 RepID=A0A1I7W5S9_LOALO
ISSVTARLQRSEHQAHGDEWIEVLVADLFRRPSPPPTREQLELLRELLEHECEMKRHELVEPVPALVHDEEEGRELAEWRQMSHEHNEESTDVIPRASASIPRTHGSGNEIAFSDHMSPNSNGKRSRDNTSSSGSLPCVGGGRFTGTIPTAAECDMCPKEFGTLKGWRYSCRQTASAERFCQKCGHFVNMPHIHSDEEIPGAMELHSSKCFPRPRKP